MDQKPNFTPRAQRAIEIAKKTASELGSPAISLEHLFLGILQLKAGVIHEVLITLGLEPLGLINIISRKLEQDAKKSQKKSLYLSLIHI